MADMRRLIFGAGAVALGLAPPAQAYNDTVTHPRLTVISTERSALYTDPTLMFRLGLPPATAQSYTYRGRIGPYRFSVPFPYTVSELIAEGAFEEDDGNKPLNHFFDPQFNIPLTVFGPRGRTSWEWVTEPDPIAGQNFSLRDAREYLARALTFNEGGPAAAEQERVAARGGLFFSLGAAMHHMQDMHQPQHVRNDDHLDKYPFLLGLYKPSRYEYYTRDNAAAIEGYAQGGAPVFPGSADFRVSRDFWFNANRTASADFVSTNYVSQGTNFTLVDGVANVGTHPLPLPGASVDVSVQQLHDESNIPVPPQIASLCGNSAVNCTMTMYAAGPSARASTLSIFDQDLQANSLTLTWPDGSFLPSFQNQRLFALNRFNFDDAHRTLIGRAVGFSAGLVNHFFRGRIDVSPPASGAYAVVDHAAGQGFGTVRATVRNATPGEALQNGQLTAIARFHRNNCYQPDLSGEWTESGGQLVPPCPDYSSAEEHIRVTAPQALSLGVGAQQELTFTFADPIPLDATELVLQVLFQGTVGAEAGAFALGAADLSEPTWVAVMNATDVFEIPAGSTGQFFYFEDIIANVAQAPYSIVDANGNQVYDSPPDVDVRGSNIAYSVSVDGKKVGDVGALPPGRFFRLAALVKPEGFSLALTASGSGFSGTTTYSLPAKSAQTDYAQNAFVVSTVDRLRNHTLQFDSVTYWRYYPVTSASSDTMPASRAADATTPVSVVMTPP